ncbi:MAG: cysteine hydrolase [Acidobacteriaceae bacterium]|nr:cysteine hydrolase [Acidobacteriaceae bacterium]MBV9224237.1 cysteine hydrolase [Acidobacteriaceae bacterium]MBV9304795.1 cysteine hydrolase [Acidobacteriaceae bacterium]MBV9676047.1 cysteine hydrolase [Acidobacteriaceae bacterium]MBV9937770.1 cysteine hydrolase [Acidobacteriaceae bacterium]
MQNAFGLKLPQTLDEMCDPRTMALIVYDMQIGILRQIRNGPEIISNVIEVVQAARNGGYRVFFTRYMTLPKEVAGVAQLRMAMAWQRIDSPENIQTAFHRDSPGFQLIPELPALPTEAVFDRITMSAFEGTPMNIALRDCGIVSVAVLGVALEVGIEPTVRHAADLGYIPIVVTDACGAGHPEAAERSLESLRFAGDAVMTDTTTISRLLRRPK